MRFPVAYYLMLLYVTVMLRPLIPMVADAWSHTFNEAVHISTVHSKYGANHLEKELAAPENEKGKAQSTVKSPETVQLHILNREYLLSVNNKLVTKKYNRSKLIVPAPIYIALPVPPPKFA